MRPRLFLPGPTEVRPENLQALAQRQIGHRTAEFRELYAGITAKLRTLFGTQGRVLLFASSSTGLWEAAVRNLVSQRALFCVQGAFSERWFEVARRNGRAADRLDYEWGRAVRAEDVDRALGTGTYDAVAVVHNETSTGVLNRLDEIAAAVRQHPGVVLLVDAVSSFGGTPVEVDRWGIDFCLTGTQKALALPAGLALAAVSDRALERAAKVPDRGYYFDLVEMARYDDRRETPATPAIPQMFALDAQLDAILSEGPERRFERHAQLAELARGWARERFEVFAEAGFESPTLTCVVNSRGIDVSALVESLARQGIRIANGYGRLKDRTFRIGHMGDVEIWELEGVLAAIDRRVG